jgi:hypothetical protein
VGLRVVADGLWPMGLRVAVAVAAGERRLCAVKSVLCTKCGGTVFET